MNTATPLRSYLDQMKQQSAAGRQKKNGRRSYFVEPIYARFMGNTGYGEDGKLQPKNPTGMLQSENGPVMIHEGEDMFQMPNGDVKVNPAAQSQASLRQMEQKYDIPGRSVGGWIKKAAGTVGSAINPIKSAVGAVGNVPNAAETAGRAVRQITTNPIGEAAITPIGNPTNMTGGVLGQEPRRARTIYADGGNTVTPPPPSEPIVQNLTVPNQGGETAGRQARTISAGNQTVTPPPQPIVQNLVNPTQERPVTPRTTGETTPTAVTPTATSTDYMDAAMKRLREIMEGGSPAQRAIQEKQLADFRAAQGMQQRVQGFEAAQGGLRPEAVAAGRAMSQATSGAQEADLRAQMAGNEMQQQETAAKELAQLAPSMQNMEFSKQNQVANLVNQGVTREAINAQMGTNLSQQEYNQLLGASQRGQSNINALVAAGDYTGANAALQAAGLQPIDWSKVQAGESRQILDDIDGLINSLGENADPNVVAGLAKVKAGVMSKIWGAYNYNTGTNSVTTPDGTNINLADIFKNIDNPTEPKTVQEIAKISSNTEDFLNTAEGDIVLEQLSLDKGWNSLYTRAQGGDDAAAKEMGQVLGAAMALEAYVTNPSTARQPSAGQKSLLEKYGIWREPKTDTATVVTNTTAITDQIAQGNIDAARKTYDTLSDADKKALGDFDTLAASGIEAYANQLIGGQRYQELVGKKDSDPLVQAVMKKTTPLTMSYNNRLGAPDTITNAPAAGTWVRYKTPDGDKLLLVTYNGHLDTAGTSNRAYLEFTDLNGQVYSTSGNSVDLVKGSNTKYKRTEGGSFDPNSILSAGYKGFTGG